MMRPPPALMRLALATEGSMAIETAFVMPVLLVMCLGGFEASRIVSRNAELRTAVAEAGDIAIASPPDSESDIVAMRAIVRASTGADEDDVIVEERFRCDNDEALVDDKADCGVDAAISTFLEITISDTYVPMWTSFGIGGPVDLGITKTVQVS